MSQDGSNPYDRKQSTRQSDFNTEHFQLRFNLKNELSMELSDWLSSPVIINGCENKMKISIIYESYKISKHPSESNSILIQNAKTKAQMETVFSGFVFKGDGILFTLMILWQKNLIPDHIKGNVSRHTN